MSETPGSRDTDAGPVGRALGTSALGNSTAFGFSIMITASFGMLSAELGSPGVSALFAFGAAAALAIAMIEGAVTRGFRRRVEPAPPEVAMLGTALNFLSVTAGIAASLLVAQLASGTLGWGVGAFVAASAYALIESAEVLLAEYVQAARGDREATEDCE